MRTFLANEPDCREEKKGNNTFIPFLYSGQYIDVEIELAYNRFRYYNPQTGAYLSKDPIGLEGNNPNLYAYVFDSNTELDEFGLSEEAIFDKSANRWRNPKNGRFTKDPWSRFPKNIQDQMTLEAAKRGAGTKIIDNLGDPNYKGMEKWEYKTKSINGLDSVVHYVRDPKTGELMDHKFKKHAVYK